MFNTWASNIRSNLITSSLAYVIDMVYSEADLLEGVGVGQGYSKHTAVLFFHKISIHAW